MIYVSSKKNCQRIPILLALPSSNSKRIHQIKQNEIEMINNGQWNSTTALQVIIKLKKKIKEQFVLYVEEIVSIGHSCIISNI